MDISKSIVAEFLFSNLNKTSVRSADSWTARCPYCGDSKKNPNLKRFHIKYGSPSSIPFYCFNCGTAGNFIELYAFIKRITVREAVKLLRSNTLENLIVKPKKIVIEEPHKNIEKNDFSYILNDCIKTPVGHAQIELFKKLEAFKASRKIDTEMHVAYKGDFKNRIILPIYENGKMIYFQARATGNQLPKYKNPIAAKKEIIFNIDKFDKSMPVVVTEGMLDALSLGNNQGTMCLGAALSDDFISKLPDNVIICLDNDEAGKNSTKKFMQTSKYKNKVKYMVYPKEYTQKDLNEILVTTGIDVYKFIIDNSYNIFKAKVLLKI